ncbi:MAG: S-layer homology domain-containing protein [Defluviitaleaceae bacterium]|nr:S-layer homology domain-containing protein [Defluviitaleaceae bacterium]
MSKKIFKFILSLALLLPMLTAYAPMEVRGDVPDPTVSVTVISVTQDSAFIDVTTNLDGASFVGGTLTLNPGGHSAAITSASFSHNFTGLPSNQSFTVNAVVSIDDGSGPRNIHSNNATGSTEAPAAPTVTTGVPTSSGNAVNATGTTTGNVGDVSERGFVFSHTNQNLSTASGQHDHIAIANVSNNFSATWTPPNTNWTTVHVRAYARVTGLAVQYGAPQTLTRTLTTAPAMTVAANAVSGITTTAANIAVNVTNLGSPPITRRGVVVATSNANAVIGGTNAIVREQTTGLSTGTLTHNFTGLVANQQYHFRAFVQVGDQPIIYYPATNAAARTFMTQALSGGIGNTFGTTSHLNLQATSATVRVNISGIGTVGNNLRPNQRGVVFSTTQSTDAGLRNGQSGVIRSTEQNIPTGTGSNVIGNFDFNLTGLQSGTTYWARGYVRNGTNVAYSPNIISFTTHAGTGITFGNLSNTDAIRSVASTTATIRVNITNVGNPRGTNRGVVWSTTQSSDSGLRNGQSGVHRAGEVQIPTSGTQTGSFDYNLTGLQANTTYWVRGYVRHNNNVTYDSQIRTFTTQSGTGHALTSAAATNLATNSASVVINISNLGGGITGHGVVWSTNQNNALTVGASGSSHVISDANLTGTGNRTHILRNLQPNTTYHYRGFVRHGTGNNATFTYDGTRRSFTTPSAGNLAQATTGTAVRVSETGIDVPITVARPTTNTAANQTATERGVVFSSTVSDPRLGENGVQVQRSGSGTGNVTVTLRNLTAGTAYYVRAYAINSNGVSYGNVVPIQGQNLITTNAVTNFTATTAVLGGNVPSNVSNITARGVVFSRTNNMPTVADTRLNSNVTTAGSFTVNATGLETGVRYYVRAFIRTSSGYSYGNVVNFTTGNNVPVTVELRTSDGWRISRQTINAAIGSTIGENALTMPTGYILTGTFSHTVTAANTTATANVRRLQQGPYLEGASGFRFEPERAITRIEVARMIHALRGNANAGAGMEFADMPSNLTDLSALRFVSEMGFMVGDAHSGNLRSFRPNDPISRAEVVTILSNVYGFNATAVTSLPFHDVPQSHWGVRYIAAAYRYQTVVGFPDGTFRPNNNMTRAEALAVFARAEGIEHADPLGSTQFVDVSTAHWAYDLIMSAAVPRQ